MMQPALLALAMLQQADREPDLASLQAGSAEVHEDPAILDMENGAPEGSIRGGVDLRGRTKCDSAVV